MPEPLHIAVLMGGWSAEREVSLTSGAGVAEALEGLGHKVTLIDMDRDVAARLAEARPDLVFNALHGTPGEDGTVQGMMDLMGLAYTHSGLTASVIAIDKELTKQQLVPHGIRMPAGRIVESESLYESDPLARPYVLKPVNEGSSVGVAIVTSEGNYGDPIGREVAGPWHEFDHLLAEPFIRGRELTVAVLGEEALAVTELQTQTGFYDYDAKYTDGLTTHICPADIPDDVRDEALAMALKAHRLLGCRGCSRADFRWDDDKGIEGLYLLEVNTQPGMTPLSLVPEQGKYRGMSYAELVQRIVDEALKHRAEKWAPVFGKEDAKTKARDGGKA
jgi:D-alanine-D-alanine ligase